MGMPSSPSYIPSSRLRSHLFDKSFIPQYPLVYSCVNLLPTEDFLLPHVLPVGFSCLLRIFGEHLQYKIRVYHPASLRSPHIRLMAAPWIGVQSLCDPGPNRVHVNVFNQLERKIIT